MMFRSYPLDSDEEVEKFAIWLVHQHERPGDQSPEESILISVSRYFELLDSGELEEEESDEG